MDDDLSYDDEYEDEDEDEREEEEYQQAIQIGDNLLLTDASVTLEQWRAHGGDTISHDMGLVAYALTCNVEHPLNGKQYGMWLADMYNIKMSATQASLVSHLGEIYATLNTINPPDDPYSHNGIIIGELRRVFGYSSWVTKDEFEKLSTDSRQSQFREILWSPLM